jgi:Na+-transporting NADH:ubiquinone oxidoreductase subunit NqrC
MYGPTATPDTIWSSRFYFSQTTPGNPGQVPNPAWAKHLQIKVSYGATDTVKNETLAFTIFGALWSD